MTGIVTVPVWLETGCTHSPSVSVLGAYFPDWLFCIVTGVVLTVAVHQVLVRLPGSRRFGPSAVVYPTLVTLLALLAWLIFFQQ
ncbi:YtcA family lipoprotein [Paraburkholderia sp. BCC1885]|uniref:YtcA family lipoprotein n=1 Tax=Paraburkholderia sp. BCC1885 TaxID=2562669 RepID=UPI0021B3922B|nr:YtcA family lipoprotein [Paraburkholderia sp. BCC1885]